MSSHTHPAGQHVRFYTSITEITCVHFRVLFIMNTCCFSNEVTLTWHKIYFCRKGQGCGISKQKSMNITLDPPQQISFFVPNSLSLSDSLFLVVICPFWHLGLKGPSIKLSMGWKRKSVAKGGGGLEWCSYFLAYLSHTLVFSHRSKFCVM